MPDKINIPISVTGAEQAKQQLGQVGQSVAAVGGAQQAQGAAAGHAAEKQKELDQSSQGFAHGGAREMLGILSEINPELGAMGHLAFRAFRIFEEGGAGLLVLGGVAAALTAIVQQMKDFNAETERARAAAERAAEAQHELREKGLGTRERLEREAAALGITGMAPDLQRVARELQAEQGVPADIAENAAIAEEFASQHVMAFNRRNWLAGIVASGAKPVAFGDTEQTKKAIARTLAQGEAPKAHEALERFLGVVGAEAKAEAPSETSESEDLLDRVMARLKRDRPELSAEELKTIEHEARYWRMGRPKYPAVDMETRGILKTGWWRALGRAFQPDFISEKTIQDRPSELGEGATTVGELIQIIGAVAEQAGAQPVQHPMLSGIVPGCAAQRPAACSGPDRSGS